MKVYEFTGKTVDEALDKALAELKVKKEQVKVEVVNEGSKGLFNFIGSKPAQIKVTVFRDYIGEGKKFLRDVLDAMGIKAEIRVREEDKNVKFDLAGPKMGMIIGYRGETLDSLQFLLSLVINKGDDIPYKRVILDAENYRTKREETLKRVANKTAFKVKKFRRSIKLEPMNPYERRIIHSALQDNKFVTTFSEGEEPYRRVVVDIKKD